MLQPSRIALGAAHLPWLALLAWLTSLSWFLTDDAFISFRYVRNLLNGHGLVFNVGERVEGYSNFLWILELAAVERVLNIRPEYAAPWLSILFTAGTLALMLWWIARLPGLRMRGLVSWCALALVCSSATFAVWTSGGGLETRQFTFFIVLAVVCLSLYRNLRGGLLTASVSLALASLTRPEGPLIAACCFAWFGALQLPAALNALRRESEPQGVGVTSAITEISRRIDWRGTFSLIAPFALIVGAHFLFRYAYYGEWLPNSYYAKHIRPWYESGFKYLWAAALETGLYLLLPLAWYAMRERWRGWRDASDGAYALILLIVAAHMLFLARLGGDHFGFRPMDFYWPLLAVPAIEGMARLGGWIADKLRHIQTTMRGGAFRFRISAASAQEHSANPIWARLWTLLLFVPVLFYASAMQLALLFEQNSGKYDWAAHIDLDERNAAWLMAAPGMKALTAVSNDLREAMDPVHGVATRFATHRALADLRIDQYQPYENMERGIIPDDAVMAAITIGVPYYYLSELTIVDMVGLTDATIARAPSRHSNNERKIAHDRWPPAGYLEERGVNIEVHKAADTAEQALALAQYAVKVGPDLWMPFDSPDGPWALSRFSGQTLSFNSALTKTHPTIPSDNQVTLPDGRPLSGERFIGDFESGMNGWRVEGAAITNHADFESYRGQNDIIGNIGPGFLTSYHPTDGDILTGSVASPEFVAEADQYLAFLIAGGMGDGVGARLLSDGEEVAVWRGKNSEWFRQVIYPLADLAGKTLQLQLFDNETDGWGHIMLDHVITLSSGNTLAFSKTHPTIPSDNKVILPDGRPLSGERFIGDFESGMNGWRVEGDAITNHADFELYQWQQDIIGNIGPGFLTSYHPTEGDVSTGNATSTEFVAEADQYLAFLIAGGMGDGVGARLLIDGEEVTVWRGQNSEWFRQVIYPLADLAGKTLQLQLFDNETGGWGHIMLDHILILE